MRGDGNATSTREFRAAQHPRSRWGGSSPGHGAIGLDAVLEAVELPAGVADLDPGLPDVDADDLSHLVRCCRRVLPRLGFLGAGREWSGLLCSLSPSQNVRSGDKEERRREKRGSDGFRSG
jgi:glycine/D-amino acid oxidase-like deaminating enzyme